MPKTNARIVYEEARNGTRPLPQAVRDARRIADGAWDDLNDSARAAGIKLPGDDRAEKLVTDIFAHLVEAAGFDVNVLAPVIEETP